MRFPSGLVVPLVFARCLASGLAAEPPASGAVLVEVLEGKFDVTSRGAGAALAVTCAFEVPAFAFTALPRRYGASGVRVDRSDPSLLRARARLTFPAGRYRLLLRSFHGARLWVDERVVAETPLKQPNADGHEEVPEPTGPLHPALRQLPAGHFETLVDVALSEGGHLFRLEAVVGGRKLRPEIGETTVSLAPASGETVADGPPLRLLGAGGPQLSDAPWREYARAQRVSVTALDRQTRRAARAGETAYWRTRHDLAREHARSLRGEPPAAEDPATATAASTIDRFVMQRLEQAGERPAPLIDDAAFARRVSLDTRGVPPELAEVRAFLADPRADRRAAFVDRMLESDRWADHWVSYWQDVLAENPGILKPKLNNSGPFRWWLYEALADNLPLDRFVTELLLMEGSVYGGGPAGFAMATQNDVPMAAKAHIVGTAFLGIELKCARCHDAPRHPWTQEQLFQLAAMLERGPLVVPRTSTVPGDDLDHESLAIEVSLPPGTAVEPAWPFAQPTPEGVVEKLMRRPDDTRERLAVLVTSPFNERFARVLANRVWKRFTGWGVVEPVDDWDIARPSHPELLDYLAGELLDGGYDLKHLARLVLNSDTYRRATVGAAQEVPARETRLFAGPARRRLSAEQLLDSLFLVAGRDFHSEPMNLDIDGRRPVTAFLNLGRPERAWQFASLSNERDRPALAMPVAQSLIDFLTAFGWRETRQDPVTVRDRPATVLQPLMLANGTAAHGATTLTAGSRWTERALAEAPLERLIEDLFLAVLTRPPSTREAKLFEDLLAEGYSERVVAGPSADAPADGGGGSGLDHAVSWSNHLSAEATRIKIALERAVRRGEPPTARLAPDWRERFEDALWALVNSPEFLFVP